MKSGEGSDGNDALTVVEFMEKILGRQDASQAELPAQHDVVTYICDGERFQVLEQNVRARGQTLLVDLLDDPQRHDRSSPIYVEGDKVKFRSILEWVRTGKSVLVPSGTTLEEMRKACAYYGLPAGIKVEVPPTLAAETARIARQHLKRARHDFEKQATSLAAQALANRLMARLIDSKELLTNGYVGIHLTAQDHQEVHSRSWHDFFPDKSPSSSASPKLMKLPAGGVYIPFDRFYVPKDFLQGGEARVTLESTMRSLAEGNGYQLKVEADSFCLHEPNATGRAYAGSTTATVAAAVAAST
mmetsp:Transcript_66287/g.158578  ORF Transcript_66287/g.158578 Transcript_66287/m.158578 type:complete len:301 (-) Transcript_66287:49-951(-)